MKRASERGMTLLEILVSLAILAMISLLIYGAFDSLSRGRKGEAMRVDRARQGRDAMARITREIQSAFLSAHNPAMPALVTRTTAFIATHGASGSNYDRLDFTAFAHVRMEKDAKESDQCEVGYFVVKDPNVEDKMDLVRREQTPIDLDPKRGGVINVLAEDIESFHMRYFDPVSGMWVESWDTTQVSGQPNRLPLEVHVSLTLKGVKNTPPFVFETKFMIPMLEPLSFGIPR